MLGGSGAGLVGEMGAEQLAADDRTTPNSLGSEVGFGSVFINVIVERACSKC